MNIKKICKIWTERTTQCSECGNAHYIVQYDSLSKENRKKLKPMKCHLPIHPSNKHGKGYMGSYEENNHTVDVYDYPINSKTYVIDLFKSQKEEEDIVRDMKAYEGDFKGSYAYYDDEDSLAEEDEND